MPAKYYVDKNAQKTGEHEVHSEGCNYMPDEDNRIYLGYFDSCKPAVEAAEKYYSKVDGCAYCAIACHTR